MIFGTFPSRTAAAAVLAAALGAPVLAAQQPEDTVKLNPIVVTATRVPTPLASVSSAITVVTGEELRERILGEGGFRVELDVLAPVLTSRVHYGVSDIDRELQDARARLERSLQWADEHGIAAHGEVGDPSATTAIEDALRDFGADEVIVVTRSRESLTWQEHDELERLRAELDVPVLHMAGEVFVQGGKREEEGRVE